MTQKSNTDILAPFDDETQEFLRLVDKACDTAIEDMKDEKRRCELTGEEFQMNYEIAAQLNMIRAFGIMYNRCVDAGWVEGVHT